MSQYLKCAGMTEIKTLIHDGIYKNHCEATDGTHLCWNGHSKKANLEGSYQNFYCGSFIYILTTFALKKFWLQTTLGDCITYAVPFNLKGGTINYTGETGVNWNSLGMLRPQVILNAQLFRA